MDLVKGKKSSVTHAMSRPVKVPPPPKVRHLSRDSNPSYIPTALNDSFILLADTMQLKKALYLSVKKLSLRVLTFWSPAGDGTIILRDHLSHVKVSPLKQ